MRIIVALLAISRCLYGNDQGANSIVREIESTGLDPRECYRIRDLRFTREDVRIYLTDGYVVFGKPISGRRATALFTAEVEGGDAELMVFPPTRSERLSLAAFANTPNLNEHLTTAVMVFTDNTAEELLQQIQSTSPKKSLEMGQVLADKWSSVVRNIARSFENRLVRDLLSEGRDSYGFFYAAVSSKQLGNFDVIYDPRAREQILLGQIVFRENRVFFNTWTSFLARSWRNGRRQILSQEDDIENVHIEATLQPDLHLNVVTRMKLTAKSAGERVLMFDLSSRMRLTEAKINGEPVETLSRESLRANLLRGNGDMIAVIAPRPLAPGETYEFEFHHDGDVVASSGNGVYFVGSRGNWYPNRGWDFAFYEMTFRYPKNLNLVATGEIVDDKTEGDWKVTRRRTSSPIRLAGFNLGEYEKAASTRGGYTIEVYANRRAERALQPRMRDIIIVPPSAPRPAQPRRPPDVLAPVLTPPPDPTARLQQIAGEISSAVDFMMQHFGPPPLKTLTVSPIPGAFGQGFPGLLYLSTLSYLDPSQRPTTTGNQAERTFFSEILYSHEAAHQWWGNLVTSMSYQDDWLMESLANYSALMHLEKRKGRRAIDAVLQDYKTHLLVKNGEGRTLESMGPIVWGTRLASSHAPAAWRAITYEKGSWIMHMLRARMGDEAFLKMLGELANRYRFRPVTTGQFQQLAQDFMPKAPGGKLDSFFEQWVYSTGIPTLKISHAVQGKAPAIKIRGTVTQSEVDEDFSTLVPIELQLPGKRTITEYVRTSGEPVPFTMNLKQAPLKVQLDPSNSVLAVKR